MIEIIFLQLLLLFISCRAILPPLPFQGPISTTLIGHYNYVKGVLLPDAENIKFLLYNRYKTNSIDEFQEIYVDGIMPSSLWIQGGAVKVIVHGFSLLPIEGLESQYSLPIARTYGEVNSTLNIVVVDWTAFSSRFNYPMAASNTKITGSRVAQFLLNLKARNFISSWDSVHIIGFSLGAHVAGIAGDEIQRFTKGLKVGRITGLDPAGPEFDIPGGLPPKDLSTFLDKSDAQFVDIIHCNMGTPNHWTIALVLRQLGSIVQAGHADFYPNGGFYQIFSCGFKEERLACSHKACPIYYNMALKSSMKACPCSSWQDFTKEKCNCEVESGYGEYLGDRCRPTALGRYYLYVEDVVSFKELLKGFFNVFNPSATQI